jgi:hypothetical protein
MKSLRKTAPGLIGNYMLGSTESNECQVLFQLLVENPVRDPEI